MRFRRIPPVKRKGWSSRRKWTCVAIPLGIFLILCVQIRLASNSGIIIRRFRRTAILMGEWLFIPKPFFGDRANTSNVVRTSNTILRQDTSRENGIETANSILKKISIDPVKQLKAPADDIDKDEKHQDGMDDSESDGKDIENLEDEDGNKHDKTEDKLFPVNPSSLAGKFTSPRVLGRISRKLKEPGICMDWRRRATNPNKLLLYKRDFTSHDFSDWYVFVSMFNEAWHEKHKNDKRRPIYVDVAANHAKRWSNTYFFDRCLGWDGICVEANPAYHSELLSQRHCSLINTCVSDVPRTVKFSFTEAYGGVVKDKKDSAGWGVDGAYHAKSKKFKGAHKGIQSLKCTTLGKEFKRLKVKKVDFLSLDVEGYEYPVLKGIDWKYTKIDVLVIECKRPAIEGLLREKGYEKFSSILQDDIYIRIGSGYKPNAIFAGWLKTMSRSNYEIDPWVAPKTWKAVLKWNREENPVE